MKSASYRISLLVSCAAFALCCTPDAFALASDAPVNPSIEIHLDALSNLAKAPDAAPADASPFGNPSHALSKNVSDSAPKAAPKKMADTHAAHEKAAHEKKVADAHAAHEKAAHEKKIAAAHVAHEKKVASEKPAKVKPSPKETVVAEDEGVPKPEVKELLAASSASAETKPAATETPMPPKLPEAEVASEAPPPQPKKAGVLSGISGGFSDILSSDSGKTETPAAPQKPAGMVKKEAPVSDTTTLDSPPPDLTASAPPPAAEFDKASPDKEIPAGPPPTLAQNSSAQTSDSSLPPPLSPMAGTASNKNEGAIVLASNDMTSSLKIPASEPAKPDLPPPLASDANPPASSSQMAQTTLQPVPSLPPMAAPSPAAPPTLPPAAVAPPPAPAAVVAAPAAKPAPATSAPAATTSGAAPNLMIQFNESETDVPLASTPQLDTLAKTLTDNPALRVNIMAYAGGPETTGIYPKRVSLARGIAVRNYLTGNKGIDIERVNVKAMGNKNESGGPGERVDIFVLK